MSDWISAASVSTGRRSPLTVSGSAPNTAAWRQARTQTRNRHHQHSIIVAFWHMLTTGEIYQHVGGDYFTRLDPLKQTRRLVVQLERLGHTVILQEAAA